MILNRARFLARLASGLLLLITGCNGFGTTNITSPGNTPNKATQVSFRVVGRIGTPFSAYISDARSSWTVEGVVPLTIIIVNEAPPVRVTATKLINDSSVLSLEVIAGFNVKALASSSASFGTAPDAFQQPGQRTLRYSPAANPDVRFYVKGPTTEVFDALIEDQNQSNLLESRVPAVILFDSPKSGTVDGIFTAVSITGGFDIDMTMDGTVVASGAGGTKQTLKASVP